jgi:2-C-methyl-D-erythritol 2,4-cyclodiphosphate synthase
VIGCNLKERAMFRIGNGYDVHPLTEGRKLIVGGVEIPYDKGLLGHSDADVLVHAIMDALLGACSERDIGKHFPDSDQSFKDISSLILLKKVGGILQKKGYGIGNIDSIIAAQAPKMAPHIEKMRENIAENLGIAVEDINIKATTTEKLGFEGRGEGISSYAVACLFKL